MISEFYKNCEIFITGGSGVVGKALIDKLLRSCHVHRVYLLLRDKKDLNIEQRLEKIRNAKIFRTLRSQKPDELQKLVPIPGDAALPNLGITPEYAKMMENVSIVFHCAATVRFDEPLKLALRLNVGGTLEALKFAETLKKLKLFMHVSTFFSNPYLKRVEPKVYSSPMDWKFCLNLLNQSISDDELNFLTKKLITGFPNTYTFTKNLAESLVNDFRKRLPVAIFRPSIVLFALSEPEPGFPPSFMGAMGLFVLVSVGILKTVYIGPKIRLDLTPQDVGTKIMLYSAYVAVEEYKRGIPEMAPVSMCSSCTHTPHTFKEIAQTMDNNSHWDEAPLDKGFLIPGATYTSCRWFYMLLVFTKQIFPALLGDLLLPLFGHKPTLLGIVRKAYIALEVMQPFMFNNYDSPGVTNFKTMTETTKGTEFDILDDVIAAATNKGLDKNCISMVYKIREVLLNEKPETLPRARKILKIKKIVYNLLRAYLAYFILRWFYRILTNYVNESFV